MRDFASKRWRVIAAAAAAIVAAGLVFGAVRFWHRPAPPRLLLAPMIGLDICLTPSADPAADAQTMNELAQACLGPQGSARELVEWTLAGLQKPGTAAKSDRYELGYTLKVPLLKLFKERDGDWVIDKESLGRFVRTLSVLDPFRRKRTDRTRPRGGPRQFELDTPRATAQGQLLQLGNLQLVARQHAHCHHGTPSASR